LNCLFGGTRGMYLRFRVGDRTQGGYALPTAHRVIIRQQGIWASCWAPFVLNTKQAAAKLSLKPTHTRIVAIGGSTSHNRAHSKKLSSLLGHSTVHSRARIVFWSYLLDISACKVH
jgi:hypothetical protein